MLLTVGIIYMSIAAAAYVWGPEPQAFSLPDYLTRYRQIGWFSFSTYGALLLSIRRGHYTGHLLRAGTHALRCHGPRRGR